MLRKSSKYDPAQIGVVTNLTNHNRDAAVQVRTGHCLVTSVGNLVPVGNVAGYTVGSGADNRTYLVGKPAEIMNRVGKVFNQFTRFDEDMEEVRK